MRIDIDSINFSPLLQRYKFIFYGRSSMAIIKIELIKRFIFRIIHEFLSHL